MGSSKVLRAQARPYLRRIRRVLRSPVRLAALFALAILVHSRHALVDRVQRRDGAARTTGDELALRGALRRASGIASGGGPRRQANRQVVVVVASASHADLAFNAVCHLRRLGVRNYLVVALDARAYAALRAHGVRVFLPLPAPAALPDAASAGAKFGSRGFVALSRMKSRIVGSALAAGVDAVLCDADVAWLRDARGVLGAIAPGADIVATSDSPPGKARNWVLNSGLYLARSNHRTIDAMHRVDRYANAIRRSEQKAFNHILCGAFKKDFGGPGKRVGGSRCVMKSRTAGNLMTAVASLDRFANGAHGAWNVTLSELFARGVVTMHANYVVGVDAKISRLREKGLWLVSSSGETCEALTV